MVVREIFRRAALAVALSCAALPLALPDARAAQDDEHGHHQHEHSAPPEYQKALKDYALPQVNLVRSDGRKVRFPDDIDDGKLVLLNFVYTSCTAVCPLLSQTFAELQNRLGADAAKLRMVSISIDPEQDTPERLAEYARRYKAGPQWTHYTGTLGASVKLQKAFQAYYGDKMHHRPVTFIRAAPGQPWVRLDGFVTPDDLEKEYRQLAGPG
jgi:protein SCO1/2